MVVSAVAATIYGVGMIFVPGYLASMYGIDPGAGGETIARLFGAYFIGFAVLNWSARNVAPSAGLWAIICADFVTDILATVISVQAQLSGVMGAAGWEIVLVSLAFSFAVGFFLFTSPLKDACKA